MQRLAGMTVQVKAYGVPEAMYNGQRDRVVESIKAEMARQRAALNAEMDSICAEKDGEIAVERERADIQYRARCALLKEKMETFGRSLTGRRGPIRRALKAIENAWAMVWAVASCWVEIGEGLGLWERVYDENV